MRLYYGDFEDIRAALADQPTAVQDDARDAARYRWLRSRSYVWTDGTPLYREEQEESIALWLKQSMSEKAMDNAIDAASAADNSPGITE